MKKVILAVIMATMAVGVCGCSKVKNQSQVSTEVELTTAAVTTEAIQETTKFDYRYLDNEEFAEKIAQDFSTDKVTLYVDSISESMAFLYAKETDDIHVSVGFSDYGNHIMLSFTTNGGEDDCYFLLLKALQSDVLAIPFDEQIDILADYQLDKIDYKQGSMHIKETIKDNIRVILIQL